MKIFLTGASGFIGKNFISWPLKEDALFMRPREKEKEKKLKT